MALIVFTGGIRSGKSAAAQRLATKAADGGSTVAVCVFGRTEADEEMALRASTHRSSRPEGFETLEVADAIGFEPGEVSADVLLLDCLGTALGRIMEQVWDTRGPGALLDADALDVPVDVTSEVTERFEAIVDKLLARASDTIVVTNEVGGGMVPTYASGRLFADLIGRANRRLVAHADVSYVVVSGRLLQLDDLPTEPVWPHD